MAFTAEGSTRRRAWGSSRICPSWSHREACLQSMRSLKGSSTLLEMTAGMQPREATAWSRDVAGLWPSGTRQNRERFARRSKAGRSRGEAETNNLCSRRAALLAHLSKSSWRLQEVLEPMKKASRSRFPLRPVRPLVELPVLASGTTTSRGPSDTLGTQCRLQEQPELLGRDGLEGCWPMPGGRLGAAPAVVTKTASLPMAASKRGSSSRPNGEIAKRRRHLGALAMQPCTAGSALATGTTSPARYSLSTSLITTPCSRSPLPCAGGSSSRPAEATTVLSAWKRASFREK
mmetsp:Transcript_2079/g.6785  ORF Transcript_2079/g.6785 Transcript_2079/m.6785 type:complete len:290 (+) Transcript_2079:119-988(+)